MDVLFEPPLNRLIAGGLLGTAGLSLILCIRRFILACRSFRHTHTQWQVVFDLFNDRIYYRTQDHPYRRAIDRGRLDFACTDALRMRDTISDGDGFVDYTNERHRRWVETFLRLHPLKRKESGARVDRMSRYRDSLSYR